MSIAYGEGAERRFKVTALRDMATSTLHRFFIVAAVFVIALACATGIAAFDGLLPSSGSVAAAVTVAPLIDLQVDESATQTTDALHEPG